MSLGSHDAAEPVDGVCYDYGCWQDATRLHTIQDTKTGWSSYPQSSVPPGTGSISSRKEKYSMLLKIHGSSER